MRRDIERSAGSFLILAYTITAGSAQAELPPSAYKDDREGAEVLVIRRSVIKREKKRRMGNKPSSPSMRKFKSAPLRDEAHAGNVFRSDISRYYSQPMQAERSSGVKEDKSVRLLSGEEKFTRPRRVDIRSRR